MPRRSRRPRILQGASTAMIVGNSELSDKVLGAFHDAWRATGFGMLEQMCANALALELTARGVHFAREVWIEVVHLGVPIGCFRADFVVEDEIVLETKSSEAVRAADKVQLFNYLRKSKYELGFLLVFGVKPRFRRLVFSNSNKRR